MKIKLQGKDSKIDLADASFAAAYNEPLVHQVVTAYLAGARSGTKAQKNRSQVRGGGAKPWRQKGTGRARAGTIRSPIFTGGGLTFAARPRDFNQKVNRKMYRAAIRSILSELLRQERLVICDDIQLSEPKTAKMAHALGGLGVSGRTLLVTAEYDANVALSARNLVCVEVLEASQLDPVSLVGSEHIVFTEGALRKVEEALQ